MDNESKLSLAEEFNKYFTVTLADSPALKQDVFKIRYKVYCDEFEYESAMDCPNQLETDEYDEISTHCLITHLETGMPAGCIRLVPAVGSRENSPLPFEKYCQASLYKDLIDSMNLDRSTVCEISRLAVDGMVRL